MELNPPWFFLLAFIRKEWQTATSIYDFSARDIDGILVSLEKYRGDVVIITNVFADMHAKYAERGLRILAFPSNQFGNQVNCFFG
uniref:Uncharacterized protein n=1 Tax=Anabas testudineus TaxID=64144 RepID=A0A3Q1JTG7_ANATE